MWDSDEMLMIMNGAPSLESVLRQYEGYGAVAVNWRMFGSSGHVTRCRGGHSDIILP